MRRNKPKKPKKEKMTPKPDPDGLPLLTHALEFRRRLTISLLAILAGFLVCYVFAADLYAFLVRPLAEAMGGEERRLIYTGLTEVFITYLKLAFWGGLFLAFPVIAAQIWFFVAPGLYREEKQAFLPFLIGAPLLFLAGAAMAYYLVFPMAWAFFLSFENPGAGLPIQMEARVSEYLSLSASIIFAFGLAFQMPVILVLLARAGILTARKLAGFRRFAIVLIFAFAAIVTPPDVISQIALALPMMGLYELSIFGARWAEGKRRKES